LRLLHYPVRSRDQLIAKSVVGWMAYLAKDARAAELGQGGQWQANFERIADGQAIGLQELCEASALYAQTATKVDWTRDVIQETPRFDYERRYSSGRFLGSTELIVRSWKQSVIAAQRPVSSHSQMIIEPQTKQHQTNLNGAVHNRSHMRAQEAGKQMSTAEETVAQLVQNGRLEEAERLTAASLAQGETVELWNDWATIQCRRNRIAEAEQGYRRALVLDGSARQPAVNLAVLLLAQGRLEESIPVLRSVAGKLTQPEKEALRQLVIRRQPATQAAQASDAEGRCGLVLSVPILQRMRPIQGWLEEQEADLLMAGVVRALNTLPNGAAVVEVGSYCGRSTVVLGSVVKAFGAKTRVYAIDPHQGVVGAADQGLQTLAPTLATFRHNLTINGLCEVVETIQKCSFEVAWSKPIGFLFIDGLHDYANVARDFRHFEPWLLPGAYIAFHDYADHYPGVKAFVNELLATTQYQRIHSQASLIIVRRDPAFARAEYGRPGVEAVSHRFTYGSASPML
jgi:predicted O-methyltransferase YrrM